MNGRRRLPALALSVAACLAHPFEPPNARPLDPVPQVYSTWWHQVEECAGVTAPLDRIEWYEVPGDQFATPDGQRWGWWSPPHAIYLAEIHLLDQDLVEHEMLHDLLQTGEHPAVFETCNVREAELAVRLRLPGTDVQRHDRRTPVQVQHR